MSYFARKLRYAAHDGEESSVFMALIELAKKKGGKPVCFVLYRYRVYFERSWRGSGSKTEMIRCEAKNSEEAIRRFWLFEKDGGKEFPGHTSDQWQKTTRWLHAVAVGGGYEQFALGTWVKVGTPSLWAKRRHKPLQAGNISHILLARQAKLKGLEQERELLKLRLSEIEMSWDDEDACTRAKLAMYEALEKQLEELDSEMGAAQMAVDNVKQEMRSILRRMFPDPLGRTPRRTLRRKLQQRQCGSR